MDEMLTKILAEINKTNQKLEGLDEKLEKKFKEQDEKLEKKFKEQDEKLEKKFKEQDEEIERKFVEFKQEFDKKLDERLEKFSKEISTEILEILSVVDKKQKVLSSKLNVNETISTKRYKEHEQRLIKLEREQREINKMIEQIHKVG